MTIALTNDCAIVQSIYDNNNGLQILIITIIMVICISAYFLMIKATLTNLSSLPI